MALVEGGGGSALPQYHYISAPLIKTLRHADKSWGGGQSLGLF